MTTVADLDIYHPDYDRDRLAQLHALYHGGRAWHALVKHWLPGGESEPRALCEERRSRAKYTNYLATILDLITSQLFGEAPTLTIAGEDGADPDAALQDAASDLSEVADGAATPLATLARQLFTDALLYQRGWWMAELPATSQGQYGSLAEQEQAGALAAYLRPFSPPSVINWRLRGTRPRWVVAREEDTEQADPLAAPDRVTRWTVVDEERIRVFEVRKQRKPDGTYDPVTPEDPADKVADVPHGRTDAEGRPLCPVVLLDLPAGLHAGGKLLDPAAGLCRTENEADWAAWRSANELLIVKDKLLDPKAPTLGHGYYLHLTHEDAEAYYVGPSGVALKVLMDRTREQRSELYRVVHMMALAADPSASRGRVSADSKREDWAASDRMLTSYADELRVFLTEACRQVLALRTSATVQTATVQIEGLDGWQRDTTEAFLSNLAQAIEAKAMSATFLKVAAKQQARRVLGDTVTPEELEEIDDEIEAAAEGTGPMTGAGMGLPGGADDGSGAGEEGSGGAGGASGPGGGGGGADASGSDEPPTRARRRSGRRGRSASAVGDRAGAAGG